jgi:hypothetical protein
VRRGELCALQWPDIEYDQGTALFIVAAGDPKNRPAPQSSLK